MATFEYEVTRRVIFATDVTVRAKNEIEAEEKINRLIADGLAMDKIKIVTSKGWEVAEDETEYQQR